MTPAKSSNCETALSSRAKLAGKSTLALLATCVPSAARVSSYTPSL